MESDPIVVSLAFDEDSEDVLAAAGALALRTDRELTIVHAVRTLPGEPAGRIERALREARERIDALAAAMLEPGVHLREPIVAARRPIDLVLETARREHAHLIVTGGGTPPTVRRWLIGSTAESIVRTSAVPVFVFRGTMPSAERPVLCPVGESPEARLGLAAAVRMARLFDARLHVLRVVDPIERGWMDSAAFERELTRELGPEREKLDTFLASIDLGAVSTDVDVVIGKLADRIVEASESAGLLVLASPTFENLAPIYLGTEAERALRFSRVSALAVHRRDPIDAEVEATVRELAELKHRADLLLQQGHAAEAMPLLRSAAARSPANASIHEALATALHAMGRGDEAAAWLALAREVRASFA